MLIYDFILMQLDDPGRKLFKKCWVDEEKV